MLKLAPLTMFIAMPRMLNAATMTPHTIRFLEFSLLLLCFTPLIPAISWQMPPTSVRTSPAHYENVKPETPPNPAASAPNPPRKTPAKTENTAAMIIKMPVIFKNLFPFVSWTLLPFCDCVFSFILQGTGCRALRNTLLLLGIAYLLVHSTSFHP